MQSKATSIDKNKHNLFITNTNINNYSEANTANTSPYSSQNDFSTTSSSKLQKLENSINNHNYFHYFAPSAKTSLIRSNQNIRNRANSFQIANSDLGLSQFVNMDRLQTYFNEVESKIQLLNNGYLNLKRTIQDEFSFISNQIKTESHLKKRELNDLEAKLENDIRLRLYEIMFDLKQKYELNESVDEMRKKINKQFDDLQEDYSKRDEMTQEEIAALLERLQHLSTLIDDNPKLATPILPDSLVKFTKSQSQLELPVIGQIEYNASYRFDIINQIKNLNDQFKMIFVDLSRVFAETGVTKLVNLLSKNKILYVYEKMHGRIKTTKLFVIYSYDMTILRKCEIDHHLETLITNCVYDSTICLVFRKGKKDYLIKLLDVELNFIKEKFIDFEPTRIKMNTKRIYLINEAKQTNCIREFDYDLNFVRKFGQQRSEKRAYCVKGDLISLNENKIFVKLKNTIRVLSYANGKLLYSFTINDMDDRAKVFLEYHTEKFLVYNGYTRLSYFNHEGHLLATNKLRLIDQHFDEFQFTMNGNFAFVNNEKRCLVII